MSEPTTPTGKRLVRYLDEAGRLYYDEADIIAIEQEAGEAVLANSLLVATDAKSDYGKLIEYHPHKAELADLMRQFSRILLDYEAPSDDETP